MNITVSLLLLPLLLRHFLFLVQLPTLYPSSAAIPLLPPLLLTPLLRLILYFLLAITSPLSSVFPLEAKPGLSLCLSAYLFVLAAMYACFLFYLFPLFALICLIFKNLFCSSVCLLIVLFVCFVCSFLYCFVCLFFWSVVFAYFVYFFGFYLSFSLSICLSVC